MELKDVKILGSIIPKVLKLVTKHELKDSEFDFVYGQEEYTKDLKKVKKQFKRQLKKTFRYGNG
jgi:hypothetical protein|tara:strand:+ start:502 stop:693 length:192 start_codon:yes stop_codon:yes gene_type:complete